MSDFLRCESLGQVFFDYQLGVEPLPGWYHRRDKEADVAGEAVGAVWEEAVGGRIQTTYLPCTRSMSHALALAIAKEDDVVL